MFLRSIARAVPRSPAAIRAGPIASLNALQTRAVSDHAISNPTLAGIEKRWEGMPPQEQAELWMQLRDRMKVDWHQMTLQEKKAGMYCPECRNTCDFEGLCRYPGSPGVEIWASQFLSLNFNTSINLSLSSLYTLNTDIALLSSLLDRFRSPRPPCSAPQG